MDKKLPAMGNNVQPKMINSVNPMLSDEIVWQTWFQLIHV